MEDGDLDGTAPSDGMDGPGAADDDGTVEGNEDGNIEVMS